MKKVIKYKNRTFKVIMNNLHPDAQKTSIVNNLYIAIYNEFYGAATNPKYKNLNILDRLDKVNEFSLNWLKSKGLE